MATDSLDSRARSSGEGREVHQLPPGNLFARTRSGRDECRRWADDAAQCVEEHGEVVITMVKS